MPKELPEKAKQVEVADESGTWENDQKKRGYYYDDSHGYETYHPKSDDEEDVEDVSAQKEKGTCES